MKNIFFNKYLCICSVLHVLTWRFFLRQNERKKNVGIESEEDQEKYTLIRFSRAFAYQYVLCINMCSLCIQ